MASKQEGNSDSDQPGDPQAEYEASLGMVQYEGQLLWTILGAFLLTETVLLGMIGGTIVQKAMGPQWNIPVFTGALLGFLLAFPWWGAFRRNSAYYRFRIYQARRFEEDLGFSLLTEGADFSEGDEQVIDGTCHQIPFMGRALRTKVSARLLIIAFGALYLLLAVLYGPWWSWW